MNGGGSAKFLKKDVPFFFWYILPPIKTYCAMFASRAHTHTHTHSLTYAHMLAGYARKFMIVYKK